MASSLNKFSYRNTLLGRDKDTPYERLQRGDYDFTVDEHYSLINQLEGDNRIIGLMAMAKYVDGDKYKPLINKNLHSLYDSIIIDMSSLMKTLVICDAPDAIKYVMSKYKLKEGVLESCIVLAAGMGNTNLMKFLISKKKEDYPHFAGDALEAALKTNNFETAYYILELRLYISKANFNNCLSICNSKGRRDMANLLCTYYPKYLN